MKAAVQKLAPFFEGMAYTQKGNFQKLTLNDFQKKWLCLFFYPLDFTFVCPTEILQFSQKAKAFNQMNCEVVGCSIDSHFTHREYCLKPREQGGLGGLNFPLLSDLTKSISRDYGVLLDAGIALRGTFLIDPNSTLRHISINDLPVGRNVEEYLRLVEGFQYADEHGEVCPAEWKKGQKTMVPDHGSEKTQDYWKSVHAKK